MNLLSTTLSVSCATCALICGPATAQQTADRAPAPAGGTATSPASPIAVSLHRSAGDQRTLRLEAAARTALHSVSPGQTCELSLPLSNTAAITLDLHRFEVLSPNARFTLATPAGQNDMPRPDVLLLRGSVRSEPGSHAFVSLTSTGRVWGSITRHSPSAPAAGGATTLLIRTLAADQNASHVLIAAASSAEMAPDNVDLCGFTPGAAGAGAGVQGSGMRDQGSGNPKRESTGPFSLISNPSSLAAGAPGAGAGAGAGAAQLDPRGPRALVVAVDSDQSFSQLFASPAQAQEYIVQLIGAVSDIYLRELNFTLLLDFSRVWPDGGEPFSASNLAGFRSWWVNNEDTAGLNLVHLFSGRRDLPYGGIAYLADACGGFGFGISGFLLGGFPSPVQWPNLNNWDVVVVAHEMGHNLGTPHTHDYEPPIDQCTTGVPERGTIMSYCHTNPGGLLNTDLRMHRTVAAVIAAENLANAPPPGGGSCLWHDCNLNGVEDAVELELGPFLDLNRDGILDSCQDCNANGTLDPVDIAGGASQDINANSIPDECEADCNANLLPDEWEIRTTLVPDANGNGRPDGCDPDCDGNGMADFADIRNGTHVDVDRNAVPDACQDCNGNGVTDWLDMDRQFNLFIGQTSPSGSVREYHAASAVLVRDVGAGVVNGAYDIAFGPDRQLYVASFAEHRIVRVDVDSGGAWTFVAAGSGGLQSPSALTFGPDNHLYVCSQGNASVLKYHGQTGAFLGVFVGAGSGGLATPWGLTFGPNGNLFVISGAGSVLQFNGANGAFVGTFVGGFGPPPGNNLNDPRDLAFLPDATLLVTNRAGNNITRYSAGGAYLGVFNDNYNLTSPWGIAIGPNGNVYAARTSADVRVVEYNVATGNYIRSFVRGDTGLTAPTTFAFRPASPNDSNGNGILDSCELLNCPADISPQGGNGAVDVSDLLLVVNSWNQTGAPGSIPADIAPINGGDGLVNIDDLLLIIQTWGPCQ